MHEARSSTKTVLKPGGGVTSQDAAKVSVREDAKRMRNMRPPERPDVGAHLGGAECGEGFEVILARRSGHTRH
jgi:hypothetical protein